MGARFQWLFNKKAILALAGVEVQYVSLILSAASRAMDRSNKELGWLAWEEVQACFRPAAQARLLRFQVVRESEATVSLTVGLERTRPGPRTEWENLFLAGDWTATGLPATIESAVVSAENAVEQALKWLAGGREDRYNIRIVHGA